MNLSKDDKMLLLLACQEELDYYLNSRIVPLVYNDLAVANEIKKKMLEAQEVMIDRYSTFIDQIKESVKTGGDLNIEPDRAVGVCKDHLQSVEKYIVVKKQMDGTVSDSRVFKPVNMVMMKARDLYMDQFKELMARINDGQKEGHSTSIHHKQT